MTWIGYLWLQPDALENRALIHALAHCKPIFTDTALSPNAPRPELAACLAALQPKDTLAIARLDHFPRSPFFLYTMLEDLATRMIDLQIIRPAINCFASDRFASNGETMRIIMAFLGGPEAQAEQHAARQRGLSQQALTPAAIALLQRDRRAGASIDTLQSTYGVSRATVYRYLQHDLTQPDSPTSNNLTAQ